jgi:hypothetical protein
VRYIERLATQVEKAFVETSKNLEEFPVFKARLDSLEESVREISRNVETIDTRLENVATLKDIESFRADIMSIRSQIDEINKVLPITEAKIPETIKRLREERDDVLLLIKSLETELQLGKISLGDYNLAKSKALEKLRKIEDQLIEEWKRIEKFIESGEIEAIPLVERKEEVENEKKTDEIKTEEKTGEDMKEKKVIEEIRPQDNSSKNEKIETKEETINLKETKFEDSKASGNLKDSKDIQNEEIENKEVKKESVEPKFVEPIKVKGKQDVLKVLKKVKEVM